MRTCQLAERRALREAFRMWILRLSFLMLFFSCPSFADASDGGEIVVPISAGMDEDAQEFARRLVFEIKEKIKAGVVDPPPPDPVAVNRALVKHLGGPAGIYSGHTPITKETLLDRISDQRKSKEGRNFDFHFVSGLGWVLSIPKAHGHYDVFVTESGQDVMDIAFLASKMQDRAFRRFLLPNREATASPAKEH